MSSSFGCATIYYLSLLCGSLTFGSLTEDCSCKNYSRTNDMSGIFLRVPAPYFRISKSMLPIRIEESSGPEAEGERARKRPRAGARDRESGAAEREGEKRARGGIGGEGEEER